MGFVVETGAGLADANSYASEAEADAYHADQGAPAAWTAANQATKEAALRQATTYLDGKYAQRFRGTRAHETQALRWPRECAIDDDGFAISSTSIPTRLKYATAEIALKVVDGTALFTDETTPGSLGAESLKVGEIETSQTFIGGQSVQASFPKAYALLKDLIHPAGVRMRA